MTGSQTKPTWGLALAGLVVTITALAQPFQAPPSPPDLPPVPPGIQPVTPPLAPPPALPSPAPVVSPRVPAPVIQPRPFHFPVQGTPHLSWDSDAKAYQAKPGEPTAHFAFALTNISSAEVVVNRVTTSCGCTVARLPAQPWRLAPGASGQIDVTVDLRGKWGVLQKLITVDTSDGYKVLHVSIRVPTGSAPAAVLMADRMRNQQLARADRQAVFRNDCARCHAQPTVGKTGAALFQAACAICHESAHRATMVPDLHALTQATDREFWRFWITAGKPGTLMPAFAAAQGGPLTELQINSLLDYLTTTFLPRRAAVSARVPVPSALPPVPVGAAP
ncbi:MAG: DUF1573 domain-containing protein [Verrucomicrobia bacterium]|nr:DUF1573 domain-containing protein [Verrucomicrobiota bacterium]